MLKARIISVAVGQIADLCRIECDASYSGWSEQMFRAEFSNRYSQIFGVVLPTNECCTNKTPYTIKTSCSERSPTEVLAAFLVLHIVLDEVHIINLGVSHSFRRQGIARYLLFKQLQHLWQQGAKSAFLEVRSRNTPAISLYRSLGFCSVNTRRAYYSDNGDDALLMNLELETLFAEPSLPTTLLTREINV